MKKYKLLGDGSYGCVIQPDVNCKKNIIELNKTKEKRHNVSKLFLNDDDHIYLRESKLAKLINVWDQNSNYFVAPSKLCKTSIKEILKNPASKQCSDMPYYSKYDRNLDSTMINQIVMPNFGIALNDYLKKYYQLNKKKVSLTRWISMIKNVLEGLIVLQKYKVIHLDLKSNNLLYDEDKVRIIDFSLAKSMKNFYKEDSHKNYFGIDYFPYPPEFLLLYNNHYTNCSECVLFEDYLKTLQSFQDESYNSFLKFYSLTDILIILSDLLQWIQNTDNWVDVLNDYVNKIDIYQFGTICVSIDNLLDYSNASPNVIANYIHFIKLIVNPDVRLRATAKQAYTIYKELF